MKIFGTITGYIVPSTSITNELLSDVAEVIKKRIDICYNFKNNNNIQIIVNDSVQTMNVLLLLKSGLKARGVSIHTDVDISDNTLESLSDASGPSCCCNTPSVKDMATSFSSLWKDIENEFISYIPFIDDIVECWTKRQANMILHYFLNDNSQKDVATELHVSIQAVNKVLVAAKLHLITVFLQRFKKIMSSKLERVPQIQHFVGEIERLKSNYEYVRDDTYDKHHKKVTGNHITYKYKVMASSKNPTRIISKDGSLAYEFLIEFDKQDFGYGIYFGCRCLILKGDFADKSAYLKKEWEIVKPSAIKVLNDTFQGKEFSERFYTAQENGTIALWPFWMTLSEGEDISVASLVTKLISLTYKSYIKTDTLLVESKYNRKSKKNERVNEKWFTDKSFELIHNKLNDIKQWKPFDNFLKLAEKSHVISRVIQYEKCYRFNNLNKVEVTYFIRSLVGMETTNKENYPYYGPTINKPLLHLETGQREKNEYWSYFSPIFVDKDYKPLGNLKSIIAQSHKKNEEDIKKHVAGEYSKLLSPDN